MASQNQTIGARGSDIVLDIYTRGYNGGPLVDADSIPTYLIKEPGGTQVDSGTGTKTATGTYTATYSIDVAAEISTLWSIEWDVVINGSTVPSASSSENFIVIESGDVGFGHDVTMDAIYVEDIKTIVGYPTVDDIILVNDNIKTYCVRPALREYFKKFPKRVVTSQDITSDAVLEIDFPDDYTFGALDVKILHDDAITNTNQYHFWELAAYQQYGFAGRGYSNYGIKGFNPSGLRQENITRWQAKKATIKAYKTEMIDVSDTDRKIYVHTNQTGFVQVSWAKYSYNFADVKFTQIENVLDLCRYYLSFNIANLTGLVTEGDLDININHDELLSKGEALRDKVYEKWEQIQDLLLIKL